MRVTAAVREETRVRLLAAAQALFDEVGFQAATTRELAARAGVAAGTVFNYFASKEALAAALVEGSLTRAWAEREASARADETLEEALFAGIATELRHLEPQRAWLAEGLDFGLSPLRREAEPAAAALRAQHLERVDAAVRRAGLRPPGELALHLYWTLYLGVLAFWTRDASEHGAATLALLDRSIHLFTRALADDEAPEADHGR